jgi:hypothetical protein
MKKIIIFYCSIFIFLSSCSSNYVTLVVISDELPKFISPDKVKLISQSDREFHFEIIPLNDSTSLKVQNKGKDFTFQIGNNGYYLLNLTNETIIASQFKYDYRRNSDSESNITEKSDSIKKANDPDQTKDLVNLESCKIVCLTKTLNVKIYGFMNEAPESIEISPSDNVPIRFQLYTSERFQTVVKEEVQKKVEKVKSDSANREALSKPFLP